MKGRKPKPTWLKLVAGNPGRREINEDEPQPTGDLTDPPEWFNDRQKVFWRQAVRSAPLGLLKRLDESVLVVWAVASEAHQEAVEKISKFGSVIKSPNSGTPMQSPYVSIKNRQAALMLKAAAEMGFTPSSRSRVKVKPEGAGPGGLFGELKELGDE